MGTLYFNGEPYGGGAENLSEMGDVAISSPTNGQALIYDPATSKWKNGDVSGGGGGVDYSTTEQDTGLKWIDGRPIYQITLVYTSNLSTNAYATIDTYITTTLCDHVMVYDMCWEYSGYVVAGQNTGSAGMNVTVTSGGVSLENMVGTTAHDFYITLRYTKKADIQ